MQYHGFYTILLSLIETDPTRTRSPALNILSTYPQIIIGPISCRSDIPAIENLDLPVRLLRTS